MPKVRTLFRADLITKEITEVQVEHQYRHLIQTPTGYIYDQDTNYAILDTYALAVEYLEVALELEIERATEELRRSHQDLLDFRQKHMGFALRKRMYGDTNTGIQPS